MRSLLVASVPILAIAGSEALEVKILQLCAKATTELNLTDVAAGLSDDSGTVPHATTIRRRLVRLFDEKPGLVLQVLSCEQIQRLRRNAAGLDLPVIVPPASIPTDEDDIFSQSTEGDDKHDDQLSRTEVAAEFMKYDDALRASNAAFSALAALAAAKRASAVNSSSSGHHNDVPQLKAMLKDAHDQLAKLYARMAATF